MTHVKMIEPLATQEPPVQLPVTILLPSLQLIKNSIIINARSSYPDFSITIIPFHSEAIVRLCSSCPGGLRSHVRIVPLASYVRPGTASMGRKVIGSCYRSFEVRWDLPTGNTSAMTPRLMLFSAELKYLYIGQKER